MMENICAAAVVMILILGAILGEPLENALAAALVPVTMGLIHRMVLRARAAADRGKRERGR